MINLSESIFTEEKLRYFNITLANSIWNKVFKRCIDLGLPLTGYIRYIIKKDVENMPDE